MRRTASDVLRNLEMRVAQLEKQSDSSESLVNLLHIPFGNYRLPSNKHDHTFYFSQLEGKKVVIAEMTETPDYDNDYEGKMEAISKFTIASPTRDLVSVPQIEKNLTNEIKSILKKRNFLLEETKKELKEQAEYDFTGEYDDTRMYYLDPHGEITEPRISVRVIIEKERKKTYLKAEIKVTQSFDIVYEGMYGDPDH